MPELDLVNLEVPLPWISTSGAAGLVTDISHNTLILEHKNSASTAISQLQISLSSSKHYTIEGTVTADYKDKIKFEVKSTDSLNVLNDLLGKIRKEQHIDICLNQDIEDSNRFTGFQEINFMPKALPELDLKDIDTKVSYLGKTFDHPILITGMTGGIERAAHINRNLAEAAANFGIPMGIGSQRLALENKEWEDIFNVKRFVPSLFLIGNIGCAQLLNKDYIEVCRRAVDMIQADALAIHLNILQELVQVEGDRQFSGLLERIANLCNSISTPIIIKEVGSGIDVNTAIQLKEAGVSAIDIGGRGGTSWSYIEGLRSSLGATRNLGNTFRDWGIPTAYSLANLRKALGEEMPLTATGGIRDGLTIAKAVALGANLAGIGLPLLKAAINSTDEVHTTLDTFARGLKTTMIATGSQSLVDLESHMVLGPPGQEDFRSYVRQKNNTGSR